MSKNTHEEARSGQPETRGLIELMTFEEPERTDGTVKPGEVSGQSKSRGIEESYKYDKEALNRVLDEANKSREWGEKISYEELYGEPNKDNLTELMELFRPLEGASGSIGSNEEGRSDEPIGVVEDSPTPEEEPFELMIFDEQESREQCYDPMTDVPERLGGLKTGTVSKSAESLDTSGTTDALAESAIPAKQDNTVSVPNIVGQFIKGSEDECKTDLAKGLSLHLKKGNSLIPPPPQLSSQTEEMQSQEQYKVEVIDAISDDLKVTNTAKKVMHRVRLKVVVDLGEETQDLYKYNGVHYKKLSKSSAERMIVDICRKEVEAAGGPDHATKVYRMLMMEPTLEHSWEEVCNGVIPFQNGALSLSDGRLIPNNPDWFTTYGLQCNYLGGNPASQYFDKFLLDITGGDMELVERLWQMMGYVLSPDTRGKVLFVMQGVSNSGKSVLSNLLRSFFNPEAVLSLDAQDLSTKFAVGDLKGKALCIIPDMPARRLDDFTISKLKQLTGDDIVSSDVKFGKRVQFRNTAKFVMVTNNLLRKNREDVAFDKRVVTIPFRYSISEGKEDKNLLEYLKDERDAIATKAISAYYRLIGQRYRFCGNYPLNECVGDGSQNGVSGGDVATRIHTFLQSYFTRDKDSIVHVDNAHRLFTGMGNEIALNTFSKYFCESANELYGGEHDRKRKPGEKNALSCVKGIRFIGKGGRM